MSSFGSQVITHTLSSEYDPSEVNIQQYNIIPYGIYDGLELSINGPDSVQISGPGVGVIYDEVNDLAVQFQQKDNLNIDVNTTEPYIIARWEYNQSLTNPVRYETDTQAGLASTDVVLGKVLFDSNDEVSGFDLTDRVERDLEHIEAFDTESDVGTLYQSDGNGNVVEVLSNPSDGTLIRWDASNNEWSFGSSDVETLSTSVGTGALYQSDGNGNVITVLSTQSNNTLARYNDSSGEWEAIQTDTSNTGNTVVERNADGDINVQGVNADGSVSGTTISASELLQWVQSLNGSNQTFLDLSPSDLNNSWTFEWVASNNSIRATSPSGNTIFLNADGTIEHADANNDNESATLGQIPDGVQTNVEGPLTGTLSPGSSSTIALSNSYVDGIANGDGLASTSDGGSIRSVSLENLNRDGSGNITSITLHNNDTDTSADFRVFFFGVLV